MLEETSTCYRVSEFLDDVDDKRMRLIKIVILYRYVDILNDTHKIVGISFSLLIATIFSLLGVRVSVE